MVFGYYLTLMASPSTATAARPGRRTDWRVCAGVALLAGLTCTGCSLIYRLPTRQGNVLESTEFDRVKLGMSKDQVQYILGTPIAADPFRPDRWDYFGYYKSPRGRVTKRDIALFFDSGDKLTHIDGLDVASNASTSTLGTPDVDAMQKQRAKEAAEDAHSGNQNGVKVPTP